MTNDPREPRRLFRFPWRTTRDIRHDFEAEVDFHRDMRVAELRALGRSDDEARQIVSTEIGDLDEARRYVGSVDWDAERRRRRKGVIQQVVQETVHSLRRLNHQRTFTVVATSTLALGLGASILMFNIVAAMLLAPLPFAHDDKLVMIWGSIPQLALAEPEVPIGGRSFTMLRENGSTLSSSAAFRARALNLGDGVDAQRLDGIEATGDFFDVLGVKPELGRFFSRADEIPQGDRPVVISDALWRQRFGADRRIVGRTITLNADPYVVAGVAPPGFAFPRGKEMPPGFQFPPITEAWIPIAPPKGGNSDLAVIARMAPTATLGAVRANLDRVRGMLDRLFQQGKGYWGMTAVPLHAQLVGRSEPLLLSLLGAVSLLLLIACVNAAQLQVAQLERRRRDLAVRAALGAPVWRLAFGSALEVLVVTVLAGALATAMAAIGFHALRGQLADKFPLLANAPFEVDTIFVAVGATLAVGFAAGLGPAVLGSRIRLIETLRRAGRGMAGGAGAERLRRTMVIAELAVAVVLVASAGLMAKSLSRQLSSDLGFSAPNGLTFDVTLPRSRFPERQGATYMEHPAGARFIADALTRIRAIPGVDAAAMGTPLPLSGSWEWSVMSAEGRLPRQDGAPVDGAEYTFASDGLFRALGTRLVAGRDFNAADGVDADPVVIVNRSMAHWLWPAADPLGKRIKLGGTRSPAPWMTVVGVVDDLKRYALTDTTRPEMIVPYTQKPYPTFATTQFVVRSQLPVGSLVPALRRAIGAVDPSIPVSRVRTISDLISEASASARFAARFMTVFGAAALFLAMIGLYGVVAYGVVRRRQEFGVRRALGATAGQIVQQVTRETTPVMLAGTGIGIVATLGVGFLARSLLYGVAAYDPGTLAIAVAILISAGVGACIVPAWRATKVEPRTALEEAG